ncbi:MAG: DUF3822 family protein [Prevotellaceae bacterium]|jgi:hypothetical protein|nr:DUF3822 family protein [Prevotellaceae bacterium]
MQKAFALINSALDLRRTGEYHLSIQSNLSGLVFCVLDLKSNTYIALKSIPFQSCIIDWNDLHKEVAAIIQQEPLLEGHYASVASMHISRTATMVPNALVDKDLLKSYLGFTSTLNELDEVHHRQLPNLDLHAVYAIPSPLAALLNLSLNKVTYCHQSVPLLHSLSLAVQEHKKKELFAVNINQGFADIALYARGGLKIYNTFEVSTATGLLYYLMFIAKQHKVEEKKADVLLSGEIEHNVEELAAFFPNLIQGKASRQYRYVSELAGYIDHQLVNLFALHSSCGL